MTTVETKIAPAAKATFEVGKVYGDPQTGKFYSDPTKVGEYGVCYKIISRTAKTALIVPTEFEDWGVTKEENDYVKKAMIRQDASGEYMTFRDSDGAPTLSPTNITIRANCEATKYVTYMSELAPIESSSGRWRF